jgi:hypothetical protein
MTNDAPTDVDGSRIVQISEAELAELRRRLARPLRPGQPPGAGPRRASPQDDSQRQEGP